MIDRLILNILEWAAGHHDEGRYSPVAIVFHWTMAALTFAQLAIGWWMGRLGVGGGKVAAFELHFLIGVLMLVLIVLRFGWRLMAPGPINDADKPGWESATARIIHLVFYVCLFGLPLTGWAMISATAREQELTLLALAPWPLLPLGGLDRPDQWMVEAASEWMHWGLVLSLVALIPLHVAGALKHQFIDRDDVLHGMLPIVDEPRPRRTRWQRRYRAVEKRIAGLARRLWPGRRAPTVRRRQPT